MVSYSEVKAGWDRAAATDPNPAIHPAGIQGDATYRESGDKDALNILATLNKHGLPDFYNELSIIDFGCGNGRVSMPLSYQFKKVYGVDFSYTMLQQLPRWDNIVPVLAVDNWFGLSEPADYAFSISVFIHNNHESGSKILKAISDNLKPGGLALIQIPIYDEPTYGNHWSDVTTWTLEQLQAACVYPGLELVEIKTNPGKFSHESIGPNHHFLQVLKKI